MGKKSHAKLYKRITNYLLQGPRQKLAATTDLEFIIKAFLSANTRICCRYNLLDELEIRVGCQTFNLTHILINHADFEHIALSDSEIKTYEDFLSYKASNKPELEDIGYPSQDDYADRDPDNRHKNLLYGEKQAITIYTGHIQQASINEFLRNNAQLTKLHLCSIEDLTSTVKEILLVSTIATHGLNKTENNTSRESNPYQRLYRVEKSSFFNQERHKSIKQEKTIKQLGFTSSSRLKLDIEDDLEEVINDHDSITNIIYIQPTCDNSIGKNITALSKFEEEKEVLFPPGTEFKYYRYRSINNETVYYGVPVRTVSHALDNDYSSEYFSIRGECLDYIERLKSTNDRNINKKLLQFVKALALDNQTENKLLGDLCRALSKCELENKVLNENTLLTEIGEYIYNEHLNTPYKDLHISKTDSVLSIPNFPGENNSNFIYRPNHGLAHSIRKSMLISFVISYFAKHARDVKFARWCKNDAINHIDDISIALLFSITGRESELGFKDNPHLYKKYRQNSANNFIRYASRSQYKSNTIFRISELIRFAGNTQFIQRIIDENFIPSNLQKYSLIILNTCHILDLFRCYDENEFNLCITAEHLIWINQTTEQDEDLQFLYKLAERMILETGDRALIRLQNGRIVGKNQPYNHWVFYNTSTNPITCIKACVRAIVSVSNHKDMRLNLGTQIKTNLSHINKSFLTAISNGYLASCKKFTENGADINKTNGLHCTPLYEAILAGHTEIASYLMSIGASTALPKDSHLDLIHILTKHGMHEVLKYIKDIHLQINQRAPLYEHYSPLHCAVESGHLETARFLLQAGASTLTCDFDQNTPLHIAVYENNIDMISLLLKHQASILIKNASDLSPLCLAIENYSEYNDDSILRIMIQKSNYQDVITYIKSEKNIYLIHYFINLLIIRSHLSDLSALLNLREEINFSLNSAQPITSPLLLATYYRRSSAIKTLLISGADVNHTPKNSHTALAMSVIEGFLEIAELLLKAGADPLLNNATLPSPLTLALKTRNIAMIKLLLSFTVSSRMQSMKIINEIGSQISNNSYKVSCNILQGEFYKDKTVLPIYSNEELSILFQHTINAARILKNRSAPILILMNYSSFHELPYWIREICLENIGLITRQFISIAKSMKNFDEKKKFLSDGLINDNALSFMLNILQYPDESLGHIPHHLNLFQNHNRMTFESYADHIRKSLALIDCNEGKTPKV